MERLVRARDFVTLEKINEIANQIHLANAGNTTAAAVPALPAVHRRISNASITAEKLSEGRDVAEGVQSEDFISRLKIRIAKLQTGEMFPDIPEQKDAEESPVLVREQILVKQQKRLEDLLMGRWHNHLDLKRLEQRKPGYRPAKGGGIECFNHDELKTQEGLILELMKTVGKILIEGKNIISLSLPVRIFEPRSTLERICDSWAFAPTYLRRAADCVISYLQCLIPRID
jgi:hypothetical protein